MTAAPWAVRSSSNISRPTLTTLSSESKRSAIADISCSPSRRTHGTAGPCWCCCWRWSRPPPRGRRPAGRSRGCPGRCRGRSRGSPGDGPRPRRCALASRMAGSVTPTGSSWAPKPRMKSIAMTATSGSLASWTMRAIRSEGSIIGCGRPLVNSSSPKSRKVWPRLGSPAARRLAGSFWMLLTTRRRTSRATRT